MLLKRLLGNRFVHLILSFGGGMILMMYLQRPNPDTVLPKDSDSKVIIKPGETKIITKWKVQREFVPAEGRTELDVKEDGTVSVRTKTKGFAARPGLGLVYTHPRLVPALDIKLIYHNRLGMAAGVPIRKDLWRQPYVAATYQISANTAGFIGINNKKKIVFGLRVGF